MAKSPISKQVTELFRNERDYETKLEKLQEIAVIYVESKNGEYETNLNEDSRSFKLPYKEYKEDWDDDEWDDDGTGWY